MKYNQTVFWLKFRKILYVFIILVFAGFSSKNILISKPADKANDNAANEKNKSENAEKQRIEKERLENEIREREKQQKEKIERERIERENLEKERLEREIQEKQRLEREKLERELKEKERLEKEKLDRELKEKQRIEKEKLENELREKEKLQKEKLDRDLKEKERIERERLDQEMKEKERAEKEKLDREQKEKERIEREKQGNDQRNNELKEKQRLEKEKLDKELKEKERLEREKLDKDQKEKERIEKEKLDRDQKENKRIEKEKLDKKQKENQQKEKEKFENQQKETQRIEQEKLDRKHEEENKKHGFSHAARQGKNRENQNDQKRQYTAEDSKAASEFMDIILKLNITAKYSLYPYENADYNFIRNNFSNNAAEQAGAKKFFINIEGGGGLLNPPSQKWNFKNGFVFAALQSRFFSIAGPFAEYRGYLYEGEILNNYFASLDIALLQVLSFSLSGHIGYTYLKGENIGEGGPTAGVLVQMFPFQPISLQFRYSIMESKNMLVDTLSARLGIHINRFEIFAGYYRFRINYFPFQGLETGVRLWM